MSCLGTEWLVCVVPQYRESGLCRVVSQYRETFHSDLRMVLRSINHMYSCVMNHCREAVLSHVSEKLVYVFRVS